MSATTVTGSPHPRLNGIVLRYAGYAERTGRPVTFRELPCTFVPIIVDLASGWTVAHSTSTSTPLRLSSFVAGVTAGTVLVSHPGSAECLQVDLTPMGARRLFGLPMSELANLSVPIDDVLGRFGRELVQRVGDVDGWSARFAVVDAALRARLSDTEPVDASVAWSLGRIENSGGTTSIGQLAADLGWSHRRLIARYRDVVGLPPKTIARITRFERLSSYALTTASLDWATAAVDCGYFDQAHMVREVRGLTGDSPTGLWGRA